MMMKNKPIIFVDFDQTICFDRYWRGLTPEKDHILQEALFRSNREMVNDWMRGRYTAEEINHYVSDLIDMNYNDLWNMFVADCETMSVSENVLKRLSALRDSYTVILMTGNMDSFSRFTVPALELEKYFDGMSNSFYEGCHKADDNGALFLKYIQKFGSAIEKCILIDDSENVCSVFGVLGGKAFRVTKEYTIEDVLSELER